MTSFFGRSSTARCRAWRGIASSCSRCFINLIVNAIEAMSGVRDRARELTIVSGQDGPKAVTVEVRDSGTGLDPKSAERVFEAFYTTKAEGIGIGLSISRSIIEAHGGRLWASPNEPHGAVFRFSLPVAEEARFMSEDRAVVFVIDDDPSMRRSLDTLLRSVGLDVHLFSSAQEFMRAERPDAPGCLVLDVRLPGMSGLAFQQELAKAGIASSDHLHHRARRRSDDRARDEGRRGRVPHQAVRRPGAARCGPCGDRARSGKAPRRGEPRRSEVRVIARSRSAEREVMQLVVAGRANKQIAAELGLSLVTVKVHRGQVMRKMLARSVAELVRMADRLGLPGSA